MNNLSKEIKKYIKRPVEIEAIKLKESNILDVLAFVEDKNYSELSVQGKNEWDKFITIAKKDKSLYVKTLEGNMKASFGDYIIKGVAGEFYPCKPDIFEKTYREIE